MYSARLKMLFIIKGGKFWNCPLKYFVQFNDYFWRNLKEDVSLKKWRKSIHAKVIVRTQNEEQTVEKLRYIVRFLFFLWSLTSVPSQPRGILKCFACWMATCSISSNLSVPDQIVPLFEPFDTEQADTLLICSFPLVVAPSKRICSCRS